MPIIQVLIIIIVVGVIVGLVVRFVPMDPTVKQIFIAVVAIFLILWLASLFLNFGSLGNVGTHRIN